ncbi:hypothetical protein F1H45_23575 [Salmonella enterica]|nr:hypothetical protein [Salmonella enterica]
MTLPVFITVISDYDKPQPSGCLPGSRDNWLISASYLRLWNTRSQYRLGGVNTTCRTLLIRDFMHQTVLHKILSFREDIT